MFSSVSSADYVVIEFCFLFFFFLFQEAAGSSRIRNIPLPGDPGYFPPPPPPLSPPPSLSLWAPRPVLRPCFLPRVSPRPPDDSVAPITSARFKIKLAEPLNESPLKLHAALGGPGGSELHSDLTFKRLERSCRRIGGTSVRDNYDEYAYYLFS